MKDIPVLDFPAIGHEDDYDPAQPVRNLHKELVYHHRMISHFNPLKNSNYGTEYYKISNTPDVQKTKMSAILSAMGYSMPLRGVIWKQQILRKNRELGFDDILHYQKIIVALAHTDRLMKEIDKIETEKVFRHKLFDVELELGEALSTFVYNKQEWNSKYWMTPLYKNISIEGIMI